MRGRGGARACSWGGLGLGPSFPTCFSVSLNVCVLRGKKQWGQLLRTNNDENIFEVCILIRVCEPSYFPS